MAPSLRGLMGTEMLFQLDAECLCEYCSQYNACWLSREVHYWQAGTVKVIECPFLEPVDA